MIRFNNDYSCGAHPRIINAIAETNMTPYAGYGLDIWCERAAAEIQKQIEKKANVHFFVGGTQANYTIISAFLKPYQSVISADSGHINVHETGAVENCGHKITALPAKNGKISPEQIAKEAELYLKSGIKEHITQPKLVYISFPTEYGTLYSKKELEEIHSVCRKYGLYLFIDGARLAYGLASSNTDVTINDIANNSDAFYCGGTKCGALFGEAAVIMNPELNVDFRSYIKQNGAMLAKGWLLGLQFYELFKDGLYFEIGKTADEYAMKIKRAFIYRDIPLYFDSGTNQQFPVLENNMLKKLNEKYISEPEMELDANYSCVRFCTSWSTRAEDVEALISDINNL